MLKTLKYDLIQTWRSFMLVVICYLGASFLVAVSIKSSLNLFTGVSIFVWVISMIALTLGLTVLIFLNFKKSLFSKEGYLTLTLPLTSHQLIISKVISALTIMISGIIILFLGMMMFITFVSEDVGYFFSYIYPEIIRLFSTLGFDLVPIIILFIIQFISSILTIFMVVSLTHTSFIRNHRTFWAIVFFFLHSYILSFITGNVSFLSSDFIVYGYNSTALAANSNIWIQLIFYIVLIAIDYFVTYFCLENKIEVQ